MNGHYGQPPANSFHAVGNGHFNLPQFQPEVSFHNTHSFRDEASPIVSQQPLSTEPMASQSNNEAINTEICNALAVPLLPCTSSTPPQKPRQSKKKIAEEQKDENYWMRRKRNNAAAKRSRDTKRAKENLKELQKAQILAENNSLRQDIAVLKENLMKLKEIQFQRASNNENSFNYL